MGLKSFHGQWIQPARNLIHIQYLYVLRADHDRQRIFTSICQGYPELYTCRFGRVPWVFQGGIL